MRQGKAAVSQPVSLPTDTGRRLPLLRVAGWHGHDASGAGESRLEEERKDVPVSHLRDMHVLSRPRCAHSAEM